MLAMEVDPRKQALESQYLTAEEIATITHRHVITVYRWIKQGKLRAKRTGGRYGPFLIKQTDLDAMLEDTEDEQH